MRRRAWLVAVLIALGCGRANKGPEFSFPASFGNDWKLTSSEDVPAAQISPEVRRLGLRRPLRAKYQGKIELTITVYQMTSEGGAFELRQKSRPEPGLLAFHRGELFIEMVCRQMDNSELVTAADAFEAALGKV